MLVLYRLGSVLQSIGGLFFLRRSASEEKDGKPGLKSSARATAQESVAIYSVTLLG